MGKSTDKKHTLASPTSQRYNHSFVKELAKPVHGKKNNTAKMEHILTKIKESQVVTDSIFYCRDSENLSVSASNKLSCNKTGQCFEIGNKNIPPKDNSPF